MASTADNPQNGAPDRAGLVLVALTLAAAVANLNLSGANVALPSIGKHFDSSQTKLDLMAVGSSLAGSVMWLGALGDRYRRIFFCLPRMEREKALLAEYRGVDPAPVAATGVPARPPQPTPA